MALLKWVSFFMNEIKFIRSFNDVKIFSNQKLPFLINRLMGNTARYTEVPPSLQLEPTNYCNIDCICCPTRSMKREKGHMDYDLFTKIIDDAAAIGVKRVQFNLHGESIIHPRFIDMYGYIKSRGLGISLATNGMLFKKDKIEGILKAGVNSGDYILFSVLGFSKEVHEKIMKGVKHEKVVDNIRNFIKLRKQHKVNGPIIEVILYRMPENEGHDEEYIKYWSKIVDHVHPFGELSKSFSNKNTDKGNSVPLRTETCKHIWERMAIYWTGEVTICCEDLDGKHVVGNLGDRSIKDLWNCDKLNYVRKIHKEKKYDQFKMCANCDWL